jgi:Bacteriophage related domain of unknown function
MEILNIKKALERHLVNNAGTTKIAFEGASFKPPAGLYLVCQFSNPRSIDPTIGRDYHREEVTFQVFVMDVSGKGTSNALAYAENIRSWFAKGSTWMESGTRINVLETPTIAGE